MNKPSTHDGICSRQFSTVVNCSVLLRNNSSPVVRLGSVRVLNIIYTISIRLPLSLLTRESMSEFELGNKENQLLY